MKETVKKALTGDFNRKKGLMFLITALLTVLVWNLPIDCFGIDGLTVVQQRIIAIFVMAVMLWLTEAIGICWGYTGMGHFRGHHFRIAVWRVQLSLQHHARF